MSFARLQKRQSPKDLLQFHNSALSKLLMSANLKVDELEGRLGRDGARLREAEMRLTETVKELEEYEKDRMFLLEEINILNKKLEESWAEKQCLEAENKRVLGRNLETIGELAKAWADKDVGLQEKELLPQLGKGFGEAVSDLMGMLKEMAREKPRVIIETVGSPSQHESEENLKKIYKLEDELRETRVRLGEKEMSLGKAEERLETLEKSQETMKRELEAALAGQNEANHLLDVMRRDFDEKMAENELEKQESVEAIQRQLGQTLQKSKEAEEKINQIREMDEEQLRSIDPKGIRVLLEMYTQYKCSFEQSEAMMSQVNKELNQKLVSAICALEENSTLKKEVQELQEALKSCSKELMELQQSKKLFDKVSPKIASIKSRMIELIEQNKVFLFENALLRKKHNDCEVFPLLPSSLEAFSGSMNPVEHCIYRKIEDLTEHNERLKSYVRKQNALEIAKRDKEIETLQNELKAIKEEGESRKEELRKTKEEMGRMVKVVKYQEYLMEMKKLENEGLLKQINLAKTS